MRPQHRPRRLAVEPPRVPGVALRLALARPRHSGAHLGGGLVDGQRVAHLVGPHRLQVAGDVDPVDDRPAELATVVAADDLGAVAPAAPGRRVVLAAGAGVGGQHHHPAGGVGRRLVAPGDGHLTALQRLPQRLHHVGSEQRELVEEQHAAVRTTDLARAHQSGAAAQQAGLAGVVVGCGVRRPQQQRVARLERSGQRVERRQLQGLLGREVGKQAGDPLGQRRLARALGAGEQQMVATGGGHLDRELGIEQPGEVGEVLVVEAVLPRARPAAGCPTSAPPAEPRGRCPPEPATTWASERMPSTSSPGTIAASAAWGSGHHDPADAAAGRRQCHRQHPGHRAQPAGQRQLAHEHRARRARRAAARRPRRARTPRSRGRSGCPA